MDIIIPSKHIYELDNPKVRDNVYKRVDINAQKAVSDYKFDTTVAVFDFDSNALPFGEWQEKYDYTTGAYTVVTYAYALSGIRGAYKENITYRISKNVTNAYISKLNTEIVNDTNPITVTAQCRKYVGTATVFVSGSPANDKPDVIHGKTFSYSNEYEIVKLKLDGTVEQKVSTNEGLVWVSAEANVSIFDNKMTSPIITEDEEGWNVTFENILCGIEKYYASYLGHSEKEPNITTITAVAERYEPLSMEVSFQGNTIGINFEKESITIGEQVSKNALSISGNELIQSGNFLEYNVPYNRTSSGSGETIEWGEYPNPVRLTFRIHQTTYNYTYSTNKAVIDTRGYSFELISLTTYFYIGDWYKNILNKYKNGKETATLTCSMSKYKNANGEVVIDADAYNLVDFHYFQSDNATFEISSGSYILRAESAINGINTDFRYNGELQDTILIDGRIYINQVASGEDFDLRFTVYGDYGDSNDYDVQINTSYLPQGRYTLSFKIDIGDTTAKIKDWQIESGKPKAYQKPLKMHFSEGDIVVPMKYTANGTDKGISLYSNNPDTPKRFKVTGVEFIYNGVTRQKLTLQEI